MNYQSFVTQPRRCSSVDPRIAKMDETALSRGDDGVLYKLLDRSDWDKYRVLGDREQRDEWTRSTEIKDSINTLSGHLKNGKYTKPSARDEGKRTKFVAPMLGVSSRSKKIETRQWEAGVRQLRSSSPNEIPSREAVVTNHTLKRLAQNSNSSSSIVDTIDTASQQTLIPTRPQQKIEDSVTRAATVLRHKYEQNLVAVEKLFDEKVVMERKIQLLEERLRLTAAGGGGGGDTDGIGSSSTDSLYGEPIDHDEFLPPSYQELTSTRSASVPPPRAGGGAGGAGRYSAQDIALKFSDEPSVVTRAGSSRSSSSSRLVPHHARPSSAGRMSLSNRLDEGDAVTSSRFERPGSIRRSRSAGPSRSAGLEGLSSHLQADADRYVQKRRLLDEQERVRKLEQQQWEQLRKEKILRASMSGSAFVEMKKHEDFAEALRQARLEREARKEGEREVRERQQWQERRQANERSMAQVTRNQLSWHELREIEEAKRRDRIERRKQQLISSSTLPMGIAENMEKKSKRAVTPSSTRGEGSATFKAEDPEKVAAKLAFQQKVWSLRLEKEREKREIEKTAHLLTLTGRSSSALLDSSVAAAVAGSGGGVGGGVGDFRLPVTRMEQRMEKYRTRWKTKEDERKARVDSELRRQADIAAERRRRLVESTKIPDSKPTKATISRAEKVRSDMLDEMKELQKARDLRRRREQSSKEASAVLQVVISERNHSLGGKGGGGYYMELNATARSAKTAALTASKREETLQRMRQLKKKIGDRVAGRKSLMEQHDETVARRNASSSALMKVASAINRENEGGNNDIFDAKEQVLLGLKTI